MFERTLIRFFVALTAILAFFPGSGRATVWSERMGSLEVRVFAPDWVWMGNDANLFITILSADQIDEMTVSIKMPPSARKSFQYDGPLQKKVYLYPDEKKTIVFAGLAALPDRNPAEVAVPVIFQSREHRLQRELILTTKPGSRLTEGPETIYLLAGVCAVWSLFIGLFLAYRSPKGAWRILPPEFTPPGESQQAGDNSTNKTEPDDDAPAA